MTAPVAVIVPAFRSEPTLCAAIDSILSQTLPPSEIVVVDDGSPESPAPLLERYAERVRLLRQENQGPGAARNLGAAATRAPYLAFLDADDAWLPLRLERTLAALEADAGAALSYGDAHDWDGTRLLGRRHEKCPPPPGAPTLEDLVRRNFIPLLTTLVRREAFDRVGGFDPDRRLMAVEDYDLWLRLLPLGRALLVPEPLALYRRAAGSLGSNRNLLVGVRRVHQKLRADPGLARSLGRAMARREAGARLDLAWDLLVEGRFLCAAGHALAALPRLPGSRRSWTILARSLARLKPR